jgi:pimeloyl-ACP methyl ester carboxylesterase
MFAVFRYKTFLLFVIGLAFLASFLFYRLAVAELVLPGTDCDEELVNLKNAHGNSGHMFPDMTFEDGTKAFEYGNNFTEKKEGKILINVNLRFVPDDPLATIKMLAFDEKCRIILGFSPVFHDLNFGENIISFDPISKTATLNGATPLTFPSGVIRYVWLEVIDKVKDNAFKSYSYLIDVDNPQNPSGNIEEPILEPEAKRPVLIIPGIMGSELYDGDELIWPNIPRIADRVNDYFLVESLSLDKNGNSERPILMGDIVRKLDMKIVNIDFSADYFSGFISELEANDYIDNIDYFVFPYDWRLDFEESKVKLNEKIESIKNQTHFDRIDIVAHSMGGLIVENYINDYSADSINKLIFVGTPHLGAPKAAYALMQGDIGIPLRSLNYKAIRDISVNSPSVYELLPNKIYHDVATGYYRKRNGNILTYDESLDLLRDQKMNSSLIDRADNFFDKDLVNVDHSSIQVYNISGCKISTPGMFHIDSSGVINGISYLNGDGTVPLVSSKYYSADKQYYVKGAEHSELPSKTGVKELILSILIDSEFSASTVSANSNFCDLKGKKLTWRSPVEVHIYDSNNNHAGPIGEEFENKIEGVSYEIVDGEKFIFLPTDESQEYRIEAVGLEEGSFDLLITDYENEEGKSQLLNDIKIIKNSKIDFNLSDKSDKIDVSFDFGENSESKTLTPQQFQTEEEAFEVAVAVPKVEELDAVPNNDGGRGTPPAVPQDTEDPESGRILGEAIDRIPDGTLVLDTTDGRTVYMIENGGKKYGFTSEIFFLGRGYAFQGLVEKDLYDYELGGLILDTVTNIKVIKNYE